MYFWSVFIQNGAKLYPIYGDRKGEFWLGGSPRNLYPLAFHTRKEAEHARKQIAAKDYKFLRGEEVVVKRAKVIAAV